MLTGPSVLDIDTEVSEWLDDFNIVTGHRYKRARREGVVNGGRLAQNFRLKGASRYPHQPFSFLENKDTGKWYTTGIKGIPKLDRYIILSASISIPLSLNYSATTRKMARARPISNRPPGVGQSLPLLLRLDLGPWPRVFDSPPVTKCIGITNDTNTVTNTLQPHHPKS